LNKRRAILTYGKTRATRQYEMSRILSLISLLALFSCLGSEEKKFVFTDQVNSTKKTDLIKQNELPLLPNLKTWYTNFNFIIDSFGGLYFYQHQLNSSRCGTGLDENTPPEFIDLRPTQIVVVPKENLRRFLELNIFNHDAVNRFISIGLLKDTIISEGLYKLTQLLHDKSIKTQWFLRLATQEEYIALDYKKRQERFYPEDIHWDSSKTRFPPKIEITEYVPPKSEE
jgi:hypothetical protein